jgi:hypothetical protein
MYLKLLFAIATLALSIDTFGQQVRPEAITTCGAAFRGSNGTILFTVGEITVDVISDGNFSIGPGVLSGAAATNIVTRVLEPFVSDIRIKLFPNPVSTLLTAEINDDKDRFLEWIVYDISGRLISSDVFAGGTNRVNFNTASWQTGSYIMTVSERGGSILGSYQIIKQ